MDIIHVETAEHLLEVRKLMVEWFTCLEKDHGIDMAYQSVDAELSSLPGSYAPPKGRLWLALDDDGASVGCVGIRPMEDGACELKRMYVQPASRGMGIGRELAVRAIDEARSMGYPLMRLDTGDFLKASRGLYASMGFRETGPYYPVPPDVLKITIFMELTLE
jgi:GNAT superfamily N-acetyltransferase